MHRRPLARLGLAAAVVLVLGCEAGDTLEQEDAGAAAAPSDAAADFAPVNRSGITGTVEADHDGDDVTVTVELAGLEAGTEYPVHIHAGRCAAGGPVAVPLGRIAARPDGTGRLTTRADGSGLGAGEPAFVQVHGPGGGAVACADLEGHERGPQPLTDRLPADSAVGGDGGGE
jgi:CHRD domain